MAANGRMTRTLARYQSTYEDAAREIQKRINTCREAFHEAKDFYEDYPLDASDTNTQRKSQLVAQYRANITQLNQHAANLGAATSEWTALMRDYTIATEESEWAENMRSQHDDFFMQAPNLDFELHELIVLYQNALHRVQPPSHSPSPSPELGMGVQPTLLAPTGSALQMPAQSNSDNGTDSASTDTAVSNGGSGASPEGTPVTAYSAVQDTRQESPRMQDFDARPATETTALRPAPRQVHFRDPPAEIETFSNHSLIDDDFSLDQRFYDPPPSQKAVEDRSANSTFQPTDHRSPVVESMNRLRFDNSPSYGMFTHSDGLVTKTTPIVVQNTRADNGPQHVTTAHSPSPAKTQAADVSRAERLAAYRRSPLFKSSLSAANAAPADRVAYSAAGTAGADSRSRQTSSPRASPTPQAVDNAPRTVHRERLQHDLRDAQPPPAGRGRVDAPTYASAATAPVGPTPAARTTQPAPSAASAHYRPPSPPTDHGADFGRENASKFYQNATYQRSTSAKPPPIVLNELPIQKFSGAIRTYPVFRDRFLEAVGAREDLEPRHKFQYLLQCLDGEPLQLANGYLITDANYFKILDRLEDRYGDQSTLATLLAQDFVNMKHVTSTAKDIRRFHDEALRLVDEMEQIGQDVNGNILWRQTLISKMPSSLRTKIYENLGKDPMTAPVQEILDRISDYARVLEKSEVCFSWNGATDGNSGRSGLARRPDPRITPYRAGTYAADADATYAAHQRDRRCAYCGRDHWSLQCNIYTTVMQRVRRLQQLGFCFLCLKGGHRSGMCPKSSNEPCRFCKKGHHHQALCRQAMPQRRLPLDSSHQNPVRATPPGLTGILKNGPNGGPSSVQHARAPNPVTWAGVTGTPPATSSCPPSAQISSTTGESNSMKNRQRKSKGKRTGPNGRDGTNRPTTACVDEDVTQMDANACGGAGLLPAHQSHLTTDRRSTPAEAQWYDHATGAGSGEWTGLPDGYWNRGPLDDEEASLPQSTGHYSDASEPPAEEQWVEDPEWFGFNTVQDNSGYAVSATSPADSNAVLLECLKTTAVNTYTGLSRSVIVFLDSGSTSTYISMRLAQELQLPCLEKRLMRVNTFGTNTATLINGFATTVLLRSPQGATVPLTLTASDRIVPPVTTAFVNDEEIALMQKNECALISARETPDLLIGQDLLQLFDRRTGPRLPNGFSITWTTLGPVIGGAGTVANQRKALNIISVAADTDPEPSNDPVPGPAYSAGQDGSTTAVPEPSSDENTTTPSEPNMPPPTCPPGINPDDPLNLWTLNEDECLKTTAVNTYTGLSRSVIVFLDSGSTSTYISMRLAQELQLPCLEKRLMRVNTFGTNTATLINGFATTVLLRSPQGATVPLTLTASDRIVPPVTTAFVNDEEIALMQKNECALISARETPDLLIGQDLLQLFDRRTGPRLPNGFSITWTTLGPVIGGAGTVANQRKALNIISVAADTDPEPSNDPVPGPAYSAGQDGSTTAVPEPSSDENTTTPSEPNMPPPTCPPGINPDDPLNLWTLNEDDTAPGPAYSAGQDVGGTAPAPAYSAGSGSGCRERCREFA